MAAGKLPPVPELPRRNLTPPARRHHDVDPDAETPSKPVELATYTSLLGYFDAMTQDQRNDLIEIAAALPDLPAAERGWVVEMATKRVR